jgi:hypothetical protein
MNVARLALAGGSDDRPPTDEPRTAQIIRFPIERRRRPPAARRMAPRILLPSPPEASPGDSAQAAPSAASSMGH